MAAIEMEQLRMEAEQLKNGIRVSSSSRSDDNCFDVGTSPRLDSVNVWAHRLFGTHYMPTCSVDNCQSSQLLSVR